jgi:hypothetical protein
MYLIILLFRGLIISDKTDIEPLGFFSLFSPKLILMAPSKNKTTNTDGDPNLTKPATVADAVLPVKINTVPNKEEVFASPQVSSDYSWM